MRKALYECPNDKRRKIVSLVDNEDPANLQTCSFCYGDMRLVRKLDDNQNSSPITDSQTF
jgi:hypothetical protein